jgi:cyclophilin family peptidyl-prolyl cis-trans isomerase
MKPTTLAILIAVLLVPVVALAVSLRGKDPKPMDAASKTDVAPEDIVSATKVVLKTTKGDIIINLFPDDAPKTVQNFVTLGSRGYYTDTYFHRILRDFVIQGGDPTGTGRGGESIFGGPFEDEINDRKIVQGTLAMANAGPGTNSSQFFIVTKSDQPALDGIHTVFGQIDPASQSVVDAIAGVPVNDPQLGRPVNTDEVKIIGFEILAR